MLDLVVILGPTATGKSKLAIELATFLKQSQASQQAEIINADALQVYKALPILTAKVTEDEKQGVPHHLLSFLDPVEEYQMRDFERDAHTIIDQVGARQHVPILVGGTAYYAQHLILPQKLAITAEHCNQAAQNKQKLTAEQASLLDMLPHLPAISSPTSFPLEFPLEKLPPSYRDPSSLALALWTILNTLAPDVAVRWHWRDVRKIRRQIELLQSVPVTVSEDDTEAPPLYRVLLFWLHAERDVLVKRLEDRVDQMIERGLVEEVQTLYDAQMQAFGQVDYSKGVGQAIGYRPISEWLATTEKTPTGFQEAIELTKVHTRQYARRQLSWFRTKLLPAIVQDPNHSVHAYILDTTHLDTFDETVVQQANAILKAFLERRPLPDPSTTCEAATELLQASSLNQRAEKMICEICTVDADNPVMVDAGPRKELHDKSKSHRAMARRRSMPNKNKDRQS